MNALKHGFRSERVAEEVESSSALEERRRTWLAQCDAQTDMDEFLITSNVVLSFNLERVWRAAAACLDREKEDADDKAIDRARELGSRLYFDPTGPISKYGIETVVFDQVGTSSSGEKDEANQPAALVCELESTPVGCKWLLSEWGLLRDRAVNGIWYSPDRLKAVRLLGFQPVDAIDQWCVAMIFVASNGFMRLGETGFEDLLSDMSPVALERLVLRVKARFRDLFFDWTEIEYRQMLIDLIDENVLALQAKLEWHKRQNARCGGDRKGDELAFDYSPRGASMRQYELRCKTSFERGVARFNKQAQDRIEGTGKRVAGRDGSWAEGVETYGRGGGGVRDPRRTSGARDLRRTTNGRGGEQSGDGDARRARAEEWERVEQKLDASDIRACGGFLPLDRTGLASGTLTERSAGAVDVEGDGRSGESATSDGGEGFRTRRPPTAACGGTCPTSGEESFTNEPEVNEDVKFSQKQEIVEVAADSGAESGLDNVADMLGPGGREAPKIGDPEIHEEDRVAGLMAGVSCPLSVVSCRELLPATGEDVPRLGAGETTRSAVEAVSTRSVATRRVENPRSGCEDFVSADPAAACGGMVPPSGEEIGAGAHSSSGGGECSEVFVSADPSAACGGTSPPIGEESFTNEPELHEDVIPPQDQEIVEVTADSGVDSGLDKVADMLGAGGREEDEIGDSEFDDADRVGDAATGDYAPSLDVGQTTRSVGEAVSTRSVATRRGENPRSGGEDFVSADPAADCDGTSGTREEDDELRELQAQLAIETVKRQARAGPMADAIRDLLASSPEAMELLRPFIPRAP